MRCIFKDCLSGRMHLRTPIGADVIDGVNAGKSGGTVRGAMPPSNGKVCKDIHGLMHVCRCGCAFDLHPVKIPADIVFLPFDSIAMEIGQISLGQAPRRLTRYAGLPLYYALRRKALSFRRLKLRARRFLEAKSCLRAGAKSQAKSRALWNAGPYFEHAIKLREAILCCDETGRVSAAPYQRSSALVCRLCPNLQDAVLDMKRIDAKRFCPGPLERGVCIDFKLAWKRPASFAIRPLPSVVGAPRAMAVLLWR